MSKRQKEGEVKGPKGYKLVAYIVQNVELLFFYNILSAVG
jgi:hypothetical protein